MRILQESSILARKSLGLGIQPPQRLILALNLGLHPSYLATQQLDGMQHGVQLPLERLLGVEDALKVELRFAAAVLLRAPTPRPSRFGARRQRRGRERQVVRLVRDALHDNRQALGRVRAPLLRVGQPLQDRPPRELQDRRQRLD